MVKCGASCITGEGINLHVFLESTLAIGIGGLKISVTLFASSNSTLGKFLNGEKALCQRYLYLSTKNK